MSRQVDLHLPLNAKHVAPIIMHDPLLFLKNRFIFMTSSETQGMTDRPSISL